MQINIQHCGPIMLSGSVDWLPAGQETLDRGCPSDDWEGLVHQSPRAESTSFPTSSGHQPFKGDKLQAYQCGRLPLEPVWSSGLPLLPIKRSVDIDQYSHLWSVLQNHCQQKKETVWRNEPWHIRSMLGVPTLCFPFLVTAVFLGLAVLEVSLVS